MSIENYFVHVNDEITKACSQILTSNSENILTLNFKDSPESFCLLLNKTRHVGNLTLKIENKSITCKMLTLNGIPIISVDLDSDKRIILKQKDLKAALLWNKIFYCFRFVLCAFVSVLYYKLEKLVLLHVKMKTIWLLTTTLLEIIC